MAKGDVFIDASHIFGARAELAGQFDTGVNEMRFMNDCIHPQPEELRKYISDMDPRAESLLYLSGEPLQTITLHQIDTAEDDQDFEATLAVFMVFDKKLDRQAARLHVPVETILQFDDTLSSLFSRFDESQAFSKARLHMATSAASWYAMGKWMGDRIYGIIKDSDVWQAPVIEKIEKLTGTRSGQHQDETALKQMMAILRYRIAGGLCYAGIANAANTYARTGVDVPMVRDLALYRALFSQFFDKEVERNREAFTHTGYALAHSLKQTEIEDLVKSFCEHYEV